MIKLAIASLLLAASPALADVSVIDNHKTVKVDCTKDKTTTVLGNENTITATGTCTLISVAGNKNVIKADTTTKLEVAGNDNTASVTAADEISVPGSRNTVSWKKGASGKAPAVSNPGKDNKVSQAK